MLKFISGHKECVNIKYSSIRSNDECQLYLHLVPDYGTLMSEYYKMNSEISIIESLCCLNVFRYQVIFCMHIFAYFLLIYCLGFS